MRSVTIPTLILALALAADPCLAQSESLRLLGPDTVTAGDDEYEDRVEIRWSGDSTDVLELRVERDGTLLSLTASDENVFTDRSGDPGITYTYCVISTRASDGGDDAPVCDTGRRSIFAPSTVSASDGTFADGVHLSWRDRSQIESAYHVYRDGALLETLGAEMTSYTDESADAGTEYDYCVSAATDDGFESELRCDPGTRGVAPPPTDVSATDGIFVDRVELAWTDQTDQESGYEILRDGVVLSTEPADAGSFTDAAPDLGVAHTYCVVTVMSDAARSIEVCDEGIGGPGTMASPTNLSATQDDFDDRVDISWTDDVPNEDGFRIFRDPASGVSGTTVIDSVSAGTTEYSDDTADADVLYSYCVEAFSDEGGTSTTACDDGRRLAVLPPADVDASDNTFEDRVEIRWSSSSETAGLFKIYRNGQGVRTVDVSRSSYVDTDVASGITYSYCVSALTPLGVESAQACDDGGRLLNAPTSVEATYDEFEDYVEISWTDQSQFEDGFVISRQAASDPVPTVVDSVSATRSSVRDYDGVPGIEYTYGVRAYDDNGASNAAEATGRRTLEKPGGFTASDGTYEDRIELKWTDNSRAETEYEIRRDGAVLTTVPAGTARYLDTSVVIGSAHTYAIAAIDDQGSSAQVSDGGSSAILAPEDVSASTSYDDRITVVWVDVSEVESGYRLTRSRGTDAPSFEVELAAGTTFYEDTSLEEGVNYTYCLSAFSDGSGTSLYSEEVCSTGRMPASDEVVVAPMEAQKVVSPAGAGGEFGFSAAADDSTLMVGQPGVNAAGRHEVRIFDLGADGNWSEQADFLRGSSTIYPDYGIAIDVSGNYAAVGAPGFDSDRLGAVLIYENQGGSWVGIEEFFGQNFDVAGDSLGVSVAVDGSFVLAGAPQHELDPSTGFTGGVFAYGVDCFNVSYDGDELHDVANVDLLVGDRFGAAVDLHGTYAIVGAPGDDGSRGAAFIFERQGDCSSPGWTLVAKDLLPFTLRKAGAAFGASVAVGNDFAFVGAPTEDSTGAVHVFQRQNAWGRHSTLLPAPLVAGARFGASVAVFGDLALVGAPGENSGQGAVYAFEFDAGRNAWIQTDRYDANINGSPADGDEFGHGVTIAAGSYVFGAPGDDEGGADAGAFYGAAFEYEPPPPAQDLIPAPTAVKASDFLDDNRIEVTWTDNASQEEGYRIYRSDAEGNLIRYASVGPNATVFNDFEAQAGAAYEYCVAAYQGEFNESNRACDFGRRPVNGHLSGRIATRQDADIEGADVCLSPSPNRALIFDGTGGFAGTRHKGFTFEDGITVEAWVKTTSSVESYIVSQDGCGSGCEFPGDHILLGLAASGEPFFAVEDTAGTSESVAAASAVNDGRWHHIAGVRASNSEVRIYIDGGLSASVASTSGAIGRLDGEDDPVVLGARLVPGSPDPTSFFNGQLDDVRLWSVARSANQIAGAMTASLTGTESGLSGYWPLDQGDRTVVADLAPEAAHASLDGGVYWTSSAAPLSTCALTDTEGNYTLTGIHYGASTKFTVTPTLGARQFDPAFKTITLSSSTPVQNQVDFVDVSSFTVAGSIEFAGTECPVPDVDLFVDDVLKGQSESDGTFAVPADLGVGRFVEPRLGQAGDEHIFIPSDTTLNVEEDVDGLFFEDTKTRTLSGFFGGSCGKDIGTATLKLFTENSCFTQEIPLDGAYEVELPPQRYLAQVVDVDATDPDLRADIISFFDDFGTQEVDLTAEDDTLDLIYRAPLSVSIEGLPAPSATCPSFVNDEGRNIPAVPVLSEGQTVSLTIRVDEDYGTGGLCPVDEGTLTVFDAIAESGPAVELEIEEGSASYTTAAGAPNIFEGAIVDGVDRSYQKSITAVAEVVGRDPASEDEWVVVEGTRERTASFVSATTEEFPVLILHDPPGSNSYAYLEEGTTVCNKISHVRTIGGGAGVDLEIGIGVSGETGSPVFGVENGGGIFFKTRTLAGVDVTTLTPNKPNIEICATTTEKFSTPADRTWVGEDLFVGVALNLIFAKSDELTVDGEQCEVNLAETVELGLDEDAPFDTDYVYGESHIRHSLIPDLTDLASLVDDEGQTEMLERAAENWEGHLTLSDTLTAQGLEDADNRSFSAGADYEFSTTADSTRTLHARTRKIYFKSEGAIGGKFEVLGFEQVIGLAFEFHTEFVRDTSATEKTSQKTGYVLSDGDTGDFYSVDVGTDPHYGMPVFGIKSGRTSNPWEEGTQRRDWPLISVQPPVLNNVPPDEPAVFTLALTNATESDERRRYALAVPGGSNPDNAVINVTGDALTGARGFMVDPGQTLNMSLSVERGPSAYTYDSLAVIFYPEDEHEIWKADPRQPFPLSDTAYFSVTFEPPCSEITVLRPKEHWRLNAATMADGLDVILHEFDLMPTNETGVAELGLEYRLVETSDWLPAVTVQRSALADDATSWSSNWEPQADGIYEVRAFTECSTGERLQTAAVPGAVDTKAPSVFALEPGDEELDPGDPISITFDETMDCESINTELADDANVRFYLDDETPLEARAICDGGTFRLDLADPTGWPALEGERLRASVDGLTDAAGNPMNGPAEWTFHVRRSKLQFVENPLAVDATQTAAFDAVLMNGHASAVAYTVAADELPAWLHVLMSDGAALPAGDAHSAVVAAGESDTLRFEIADDYRSYTDGTSLEAVVPVHWGDDGTIPLHIALSLECRAPNWALDADRRFASSMPLILDLNVADGTTAAEGDLLSAWVGRELRGAAPVGSGGRAYLTVGSDAAPGAEFVTFKAFDASACAVLESTSAQSAFGDLAAGEFAAIRFDPLYRPDPSDPLRLAGSSTPVQVAEMGQGWTFFSTNRSAQPVASVLSTVVPTAGDVVKDRSVFTQWAEGYGWVGTLQTLEPGAAYMARLERSGSLYLLGEPADPATTAVPITSGWSWIGYVPDGAIEVNEALADLAGSAQDGDLIKSQFEFAVFSGGSWVGSLTEMAPGLGYKLYLEDAAGSTEFTYPNAAESAATTPALAATAKDPPDKLTSSRLRADESGASRTKPDQAGKEYAYRQEAQLDEASQADTLDVWRVDPRKYPASMTLVARVDEALASMVAQGAMLGAFQEGAVRGTARPHVTASDSSGLFFLMIHGHEEGSGDVTYRLHDPETDEAFVLEGGPTAFSPDASAGTVAAPVILSKAAAPEDLPTEYDLFPNYPNPFNPRTTIRYDLPEAADARIVVFDVLGRQVSIVFDGEQAAGRHEVVFDAERLASGTYFYRLTAEGASRTYTNVRQMMLVR